MEILCDAGKKKTTRLVALGKSLQEPRVWKSDGARVNMCECVSGLHFENKVRTV